MRKVNELIIQGEADKIANLADRIDSAPENGWKRDREVEARFLPHRGPKPADTTPSRFCFLTPAALDEPQSRLLLMKTYSMIQVSNILPVERIGLTDEQYNHILDQFKKGVLDPVTQGLDVDVRVDPFRIKLEILLSPMALKKLETFSRSSDRRTIGPDDRRNWLSFVSQAHLDNSILESDALDWWLDHSGWSEDQRRQLIESYREGLSMLLDYDEARFERTR